MKKQERKTLEELIDVAPEESELEKNDPDKLDLEEPARRIWLSVFLWVSGIVLLIGGAYTGYLVYKSNQGYKDEKKIIGKIDLDSNNMASVTPEFVYVNISDGLNLRSEPSASSEILALLPNATKLAVIKFNNGWYHVKYTDREGYVSGDFVTKALPPSN